MTATTRHAGARHRLLALLSLLLVVGAWACGTRALSYVDPADAVAQQSRVIATASTDVTAEKAGGAAETARDGSSRCEAPGSPAPCRKVFVAQPDLRLAQATDIVLWAVGPPAETPPTVWADVCRDVVISGLSPPTAPSVLDRLRM
ncbi:hypothetical protein RKD26_001502 [Streptomyces calvus]|uniref:hypothetical protein n=1 Tax=Streptomyces calvus TaxID=67282 RepID=UPI0035147505